MEDELDILDNGTDTAYKGARPSFLTVLCILTFVGTGLGIIYSFFMLFWISTMERMFESVGDLNDVSNLNDQFANSYRWMKWSMIGGVLANLLCLSGAIVMWKMRRIGFYLYIVGQVIPLIFAVLSFNSIFGGGMFNSFGIVGMIAGMIFPIGFIVMYGLNFRFLR